MNKVKSFCMLVAILLPLATLSAQDIWDGSVATAFAGGSGTADNPYQISNGAELAYLAKITNENANQTDGKYYKLTDDIVLNENVLNKNYELNGTPTHEWTPIADIGYYSIESSSFMGDFDGDGHTISGLYVTRSEGIYPYSSLFGSIGGQAVIHDLAVIDSYAYCTYTAALIVANMTNTSAVRRCYADGLVDGNEYIGLLVGTTTNGMSVTIEDCYAKGTNNYTYGGGFIGYTGGGTVNRCFSVGKLPNGGHSDIGSYSYSLNYSKFYYDNTVTSAPSLHATGKTTEEMQSEAFAELLGEPFVYVADNYPYIDGLPAIGEKSADKSGFRLNSGTLENGDGCSFRYYRELSGTTPKKMTRRAESGTKVYLKLMLNKRKMLGTGGVILKDEAEQSVALTEEAENVWSFTMPDSHVNVSAAFVTDDSASELWDGSVADSFAGGTGTESDPYLITNGSELAYLSKITKNNPSQTQGVYYKLMSNIVLNENVLTEDFQLNGTPENIWIPIGDAETPNDYENDKAFQGYFDGNSYVISGLYCPSAYGIAGLFGAIYGGEVHDVAVIDAYAKGSRYAGAVAGGITGYAKMNRCYGEGRIVTEGDYCFSGGVLGHIDNGCEVRYCYTSGRTESNKYAGGVTGWINGGSIYNSFAANIVEAPSHLSRGNSTVFYDSNLNPSNGYGTAKTTSELQSEAVVEELGTPFVYAAGNYPYIEGLPKVGEKIYVNANGYRINRGPLTNGRRSTLRFYQLYNGSDVSKSISFAEAGQTVYMKLVIARHLLLDDEGIIVKNDETGGKVTVTAIADGIYSFTMPETSVTVSASFYRDPSLPNVWDGTVAEAFAEGTGTENDPYLISCGEELAYLAQLTNANTNLTKGKYYKLTEDIYLNDRVLTDDFDLDGTPENIWTPIGKDYNNSFQGNFNGNNHFISGAYIVNQGDYPAFFGYIDNGTVSNLSLVDTYSEGYTACGLAYYIGYNSTATVSRCYVEASAKGNSHGYILAYGLASTGSVIENCYVSGKVNAPNGGALLYYPSNGNIRNCFAAVKNVKALFSTNTNVSLVSNVYSDEDLGINFSMYTNYSSKHTIEMHTTDFAATMGEPFEYVLGNYPYIPGLQKIGENRGWKTPADPTHGGAGGTWDGETSITFASGTGTEADPYIINNGAQLSYLAKLTNANGNTTKGKYYKLDADIVLNKNVLTNDFDLNGTPANVWEPIGKVYNNSFQGNFNGNNHSISGAYIVNQSDYPAFFGYIDNGTVSNLSLVDTYSEGYTACGLVYYIGYNSPATVSRCYVEATAKGSSQGYILAHGMTSAGSVIENCYVSGKVDAESGGALLYYPSNGNIRNCFAAVRNVKALCSTNTNVSLVSNVYSDEDIGINFSMYTDYSSKHTIEMHTTDFAETMGEPFEYVLGNYPYIPGLQKIGENRGWTTPADPSHSSANGTWGGGTSITYAGGTGTEEDPYIINNGDQLSYLAKLTNANGNLTKGKYFKLGADIILNEQVLTDGYSLNGTPANTWISIGNDYNSGFQGHFEGNGYNISGVYIKEGEYVGLFGCINNATIQNLSVLDTYVDGTYAAGLVSCAGYQGDCSLDRCFVDAAVNGSSYAGVMICYLYGSSIVKNSYVNGRVLGGSYPGGIISYYANSDAKVEKCYSTARNAYAIGTSSSDNMKDVYFDSDLSGYSSSSREDFRSAKSIEMQSVEFAAQIGAPYEYCVGYYPYIYGMHKIDKNGKTVIVGGYSLRLGTLTNGSDCNIEFYRSYDKNTEELTDAIVSGSKVFINGASKIYAKVTIAAGKRLSDDGLVASTSSGNIAVSEVVENLYEFSMPEKPVTISAKFVFGGFCGNPEVNNGRDMRWGLSDDKTTLTIAGTGNMYSNAWTTHTSTVKTIEVGEGVTNVMPQAFKGMTKAKTVTLPATLTTIGSEAFSGCTATVDLRPCTQLTALHANEFAQFTGTVYLPATVTTIEAETFSGNYAAVQHVYSPVESGTTLYANGSQVPDVKGLGDIAKFGITKNEAVSLIRYVGYVVNRGTIAGEGSSLKFFTDQALTTEIPNGYKAIRENDHTKVYVKALPGTTKILFREGLTVKTSAGNVTVTQESDDVFSFIMPLTNVTVSAKFSTGGYCGQTDVNSGHNLVWTLDNGTLAFQKNVMAAGDNQAMGSWESGKSPWYSLRSNIKTIDFGTATSIGSNAFDGCTALVALELQDKTGMSIGTKAFPENTILIVPAEKYDTYTSTAGWSAYAGQMAKDKETFSMKNGQQWAIYYSRVGRTLPAGYKAYTVTGLTATDAVTSAAIGYVPAGQPVLIEHADKTADNVVATTSATAFSVSDATLVCLLTTNQTNMLQWLSEPKAVKAGQGYTLYKDEFVLVGTGTLPAGIAFLPASGTSSSRLGINTGDGTATGIVEVDSMSEDSSDSDWYTVDGKRLASKPTKKGYYIHQGRKVVVR